MQYWKEGKVEFIGDPERVTDKKASVIPTAEEMEKLFPEDIANP